MDVLSKYIAHAGVCSRRKAADLIKEGQVTVNGAIMYDPGYRVAPQDHIKVDKKIVRQEHKVYILLNKPRNCVTTVSDERGRNTVLDLLEGAPRVRLYPVGRLDRATTGLLVLTNDGDLAQRLSHPRYQVSKVYYATLTKPLTDTDLHKIKEGIILEDGAIKVDDIAYVDGRQSMVVKIALHSGQNRIVRRIFEHLGYDIKRLDRVGYAGLTKKDLLCGRWRFLTAREVVILKRHGSITS